MRALALLVACAEPPPAPPPPVVVAAPVTPVPPPPRPPVTVTITERSEEGIASYYADMLKGSRTASGDRYDPRKRTCAHLSHKFGTVLALTAIETGARSECVVNDRGPFDGYHILDVSKVVAKELGMLDTRAGGGVLHLRITRTGGS